MKLRKLRVILTCLVLFSPLAQGEELSNDESEERPAKARLYHFGVGVAKAVDIGADSNQYEQLFGGGSTYPEVWGEVTLLPIVRGLDLGLSFKMGLYRDSGKSAKGVNAEDLGKSIDLNPGNVDTSQKSILTLIPVQGAVNLSYSPFSSRFMVLNLWSGMSYTFVENTTQAKLDDSIDQSEIKPFVNSGFNQESVAGVSLSFDVSAIDPRSSYSLKVYGISGIFLTPFMQVVKTVKNNVGNYDRTVMGLMFSFETTGT